MPSQVRISKKSSRITVILPGDRRLTFSPGEDIYAEADPNDSNKIFIKILDTNDIFVGPLSHTQYRDSGGVVFDATRDAVVIALNAILNPDDVTLESDSNGDIILDPNGTGEITLSALTGAINLTSNDINIGSALEIDGNIFKITSNNIDAFGTGALVGAIKFYDQDDSNYVRLAIPQTVAADYTLLLPGADGSNGQAMVTDGSGNLSFSTIADTNTNLGNTDLTLSGARVVEMGTSSVDFQSSSTSKFKIFSTGTVIATSRLTVQGNGTQGGSLRVKDGDNSHILSLQSPSSLDANLTFVLPSQDGSDGQALMTDGDGNLFFDSVSGGSTTLTQVYSQNFFDDISTLKHYLPFKDINEQTTIYQEEAAMLMPFDGRIKSISLKTSSLTGNGSLIVGVSTLPTGSNIFSSQSWTEQETETIAVGSTDDNHTFHFVFDNAKHFDAGDSCVVSLRAATDVTGNGYWYVTTVVEYDTSNNLGSSSTEHETNP
ncbi:MAG: hypothetical protein CMI60_08075 [Parvibaculum sp.]|nr:hypothetical protein [Parvibaculum sp.]|tara:strand:- start:676 stop:2142 length:1467 start_codon:yes stop_codon:yes gene_type:complete